MTADVSRTYDGTPPARHTGAGRLVAGLLGVAAVVVGGVLLFNPYTAARTLALVMGLALVIGGCLEIAAGWDSARRWPAVLPGVILVAGGVLAASWPEATLWTLALLTGLSLVLHGIGRVVLALLARAELPGWGWLALAGVLNILVGILAIAWPEATVVVLSLILGFQILLFGLVLLAFVFIASPRAAAPGR